MQMQTDRLFEIGKSHARRARLFQLIRQERRQAQFQAQRQREALNLAELMRRQQREAVNSLNPPRPPYLSVVPR